MKKNLKNNLKISEISLNFLPLNIHNFEFDVYIRDSIDDNLCTQRNLREYYLDKSISSKSCVGFEPFEGSVQRKIYSKTNLNLTKWFLSESLIYRLQEAGIKYEKDKKIYKNRVYIIVEEIEGKGKRTIWLEPYYLSSKGKFGFLIDYKFLKDEDVKFDKTVQRLSFSLNLNYETNKSYHIDKYRYITDYLKKHFKEIKRINKDVQIIENFERLECNFLKSKRYIFKNNKISYSQFKGLMDFGPYDIQDFSQIRYIYLIQKDHKTDAYKLIEALNGKTFPTFRGLNKLSLPLQTKNNTKALFLSSFDSKEIQEILSHEDFENSILISIIPSKEEEFYYALKNHCLQKNIPLQVVHVETISDNTKLKWSISSIALQIFTKLGGIPWIVQSESKNCLIVGIGQSIRRDNKGIIKRFFAYAVLLESTGKFLSLKPLASTDKKDEYLKLVTQSIKELLEQNKIYNKIIFHIPEKIKKKDIKVIEDVLKNVNSNIELYIVRINENSKFFGYDTNNNSLIPYESTYIQLSNKEYLIWSEGLNYNNPTPKKRYGNPLYVEIYYSNSGKDIKTHKSLLQDIVNLSGANYRGFNAKSLPVSIYYPKLISNFNKNFDKFNFEIIIDKTKKAWFL